MMVTMLDEYQGLTDDMMGHSQPSGPTAKLIQVLWPKWWPFLTEQTNELPEV